MKEKLIELKFLDWLAELDVAPYPVMFWDIPEFIRNSYVQKWLREKYNTHIEIRNHENKWYWELKPVIYNWDFSVLLNLANKNKELGWDKVELNSYEEALEIGLQEVLKLIN